MLIFSLSLQNFKHALDVIESPRLRYGTTVQQFVNLLQQIFAATKSCAPLVAVQIYEIHKIIYFIKVID